MHVERRDLTRAVLLLSGWMIPRPALIARGWWDIINERGVGIRHANAYSGSVKLCCCFIAYGVLNNPWWNRRPPTVTARTNRIAALYSKWSSSYKFGIICIRLQSVKKEMLLKQTKKKPYADHTHCTMFLRRRALGAIRVSRLCGKNGNVDRLYIKHSITLSLNKRKGETHVAFF